jgi:hypothetical protein
MGFYSPCSPDVSLYYSRGRGPTLWQEQARCCGLDRDLLYDLDGHLSINITFSNNRIFQFNYRYFSGAKWNFLLIFVVCIFGIVPKFDFIRTWI